MANPIVIPALNTINFGMMVSDDLCAYLDNVVAGEAAAKAAGVAYMNPSKTGPVAALYSVNVQRLPIQTATFINAIKGNNARVYNLTLGDWYKMELRGFEIKNDQQRAAQDEKFKTFKNNDPSFDKNLLIYAQHKLALAEATSKTKPGFEKKIADMDKISLTPSTPGAMRSWHQNDSGFLPMRALTDGDIAAASAKAQMYHAYIVENVGLQNKQKKKGVAEVYTGYIEYQAGGWNQAIQDGRVCYDYIDDKFYFTATHYQQRKGRETMNPWWHVNV